MTYLPLMKSLVTIYKPSINGALLKSGTDYSIMYRLITQHPAQWQFTQTIQMRARLSHGVKIVTIIPKSSECV